MPISDWLWVLLLVADAKIDIKTSIDVKDDNYSAVRSAEQLPAVARRWDDGYRGATNGLRRGLSPNHYARH